MFPFIHSLSSSRLWMQCDQLLQASVALTSPIVAQGNKPFLPWAAKKKRKEKEGREKKKKKT